MEITRFTVEHIRLTTAKPFDKVRADFERQLGKFDPLTYKSLIAGQGAEAARAGLQAMVGPSGFMLFAAHEHGSLLRIVGKERKAVQWIVGNPLFAVEMTQHVIGASLYAPVRVLLYVNDAGVTCLEYDRAASLFGQFGDKQVGAVAAMLDQKLAALAALAMG